VHQTGPRNKHSILLSVACALLGDGELGPHLTQCGPAEDYLHATFHLIHSVVWPQYTSVTDRQDRQIMVPTLQAAQYRQIGQRSHSRGRTVLQTVAQKRFALCYWTFVCPVTLLYCGQTVGWIKMKLGIEVGFGRGNFVLDGDTAPPPQTGTAPTIFGSCLL